MHRSEHIAALHTALWSVDRRYRMAWYVWPAATAAIICGWILVEAPPATTGGPISRPAASSAKPSASNNFPTKTTPVDSVQFGLLRCFSRNVTFDVSTAACTGLIDGAKVKGRQLAEVLVQRGFLQREAKPEAAMIDFDAALKIEPALADALSNRAWIHMTRQRYDLAVEDLNKALDLSSPATTAGTAHYYRGYAYLRLENYQQALADLNQAIQLEPYNADFYLARGETERASENYATALRDFDEAAKRAPRDARGLIGRASVLEATGRFREALAALDAALKLDPTNTFAASERDRLLAQFTEGNGAGLKNEVAK